MKKIIKTLLVVMVVILALTAFVACKDCEHTGGAATCTEPAVCEKCGKSYGEALGHNEVFDAAVQPTCTEAGVSAKSYCSGCGEVYVDAIVIPALGHTMEDVAALAPTCTAAGYSAHKACATCGHTEGKEDYPDLGGHTIVDVEAKDPTCTEAGYTAHQACTACGATDNNYEEIAKLPHTDADSNGKCDVCENYFLPEGDVSFKLKMVQANKGQTLYFTGAMNGYYFATSEDVAEAVDLYLEAAEGGCYIYFLDGETKNYLYVEVSGSHTNIKFGETQAVWTLHEESGALVTVVGEETYYIGTYGTYVTISASNISYITGDNASKVDVSQFIARAVVIPAAAEEEAE